jgi:DNA-binding transcriptional MerR regulator
MGYRIKEVSDISGISVRMLRHYDKTGLLKPDGVLENGYRDYSASNLDRLQRIMYLKELEFSIPDMKRILSGKEKDITDALRGQERLLIKKKERLEGIISLIRKTINIGKGDSFMNDMDKFKAFDMKEIEENKKKYAEETEQKYGGTKAYEQSKSRTGRYSPDDWKRITAEADEIYGRFVSAMASGPESQQALDAAAAWKEHLNRNYYDCTEEIFAGLAEMYIADPRFTKNIDKHAKGLAVFMSAAMKAFLKNT